MFVKGVNKTTVGLEAAAIVDVSLNEFDCKTVPLQ